MGAPVARATLGTQSWAMRVNAQPCFASIAAVRPSTALAASSPFGLPQHAMVPREHAKLLS